MKIFKSSILFLMTALVIGVTSCTDKAPGLQSLIPADADILVSFDMSRTFENAGCEAGNSGITLTPTVKKLLEAAGTDEDALSNISKMRGIDFANIYVVASDIYGKKTKAALLTEIVDMNALTESLNNLDLDNQMIDDYMVYDASSSILIRDNIMWISDNDPSVAIKNVESIKSMAAEKSVGSVNWVSSYLASDRCLNVLVNFAGMPEDVKKQLNAQPSYGAVSLSKLMEGRMALSFDFNGLEAVMKVNGMDADGKAIDVTGAMGDLKLTTINTDFLNYLSADDILVGAMSIPENYPWKEILSALASNAGIPQVQLQMVLPYLEDIQGTVAIAAGPTNGVASFNTRSTSVAWDAMIFVTLKAGKADQYFDLLSQMASSVGKMNLNKADKSLTVDVLDTIKLHLAVRDDMLVVSTHEIEKTGASVFSKSDFSGQYGTLVAKIGKNTRLAEDLQLPFGVYSGIFADDNTGMWSTELTDCSGLFLDNVLKYFASQCM